METVAITNWNGIVSPLYDASCCLLVVSEGALQKEVDVRRMSLADKTRFCTKAEVEVLICGAISAVGAASLENAGITLIPWICGTVNDVIAAYRNHTLSRECFAMPGCTRSWCRKRRHQSNNREITPT